ncbi:GPI10 [Candida oxycetoniae]|uniref:Mannosyltransferase n=1 Tax=Candida oxycetoniae TaxID=497107 RepID=A0AAI9SUF2_9ASCO|nr:GPI10 [Candida oxycetoniae]KAI3403261.1 GPI10 [Candida oxycetoniae]
MLLIEFVPKILGAFIASWGEYYLYYFVQEYTKNNKDPIALDNVDLPWVTLSLSLLNPFNWYVSTRSFSNNLETTLTIMALRYWPWNLDIKSKGWFISLACGVVSCIIRPTNILIWSSLGIHLMLKTKRLISLKWILCSFCQVVAILMINTLLDYLFYKELTFPVYNFLEFNVFKNLSIFYGVAPWHFYIFQAIPLMMTTYLPLLIYGLKRDVLLLTSIVYLIGFSVIQHKEFRFIMPLQPLMIYFTARGFRAVRAKYLIVMGILLNILIALFFANINERGVMDVVRYLKAENQSSIGFIMPCHSTPWQSHFHNRDLDAWFLRCEPPLHLTNPTMNEINVYRDESDQFYDNPKQFLTMYFNQDLKKMPENIVIFEALEKFIKEEFSGEYYEHKRFFNSYFHWDDRRNGDVIVYKRITPSSRAR